MRYTRVRRYFAEDDKYKIVETSIKSCYHLIIMLIEKSGSRLIKVPGSVFIQKGWQRETTLKKAYTGKEHVVASALYRCQLISKQPTSNDLGYGLLERSIVIITRPPYYATGYY